MRAMRRQQRVNYMRHVAVVAQTARRGCRVVRVLGQPAAVLGVAPKARLIGVHLGLEHEVGVVAVHGMAGEATEPAAALLIARRQGHGVVFQGGGQGRAVAPKAAVDVFLVVSHV